MPEESRLSAEELNQVLHGLMHGETFANRWANLVTVNDHIAAQARQIEAADALEMTAWRAAKLLRRYQPTMAGELEQATKTYRAARAASDEGDSR